MAENVRKIKSAYTRTRVQTSSIDAETNKVRKTRAVQSEAKHADINNIVAKAHKTGQLPVLMQRQHIEQLPDVESYQDALNKVVFAQQQFERLPSQIRDQFKNDPSRLLEAVEASDKNPEIKKYLENLGILEKPEPPPAEQSDPLPAGADTGGEATAQPAADAAESTENA